MEILMPTHKPSVSLYARPDRKNELAVIREIFCEDVYRVADKILNSEVIVDVGANIGVFTAYCLSHSPKAQVIAVEPEPNNIKLFNKNLKQFKQDRFNLHEVAVSNYVGESTIEDNSGDSRLGTMGSNVKVTTLDRVLSEYPSDIDIMKIDIEGEEEKVIMKMSQKLQERVKYFAIEVDDSTSGFGRMVTKLAETHRVTTLGKPSRGAFIYAQRF